MNNLIEYADPEMYHFENRDIERSGDWDGSLLSDQSRLMILACGKR